MRYYYEYVLTAKLLKKIAKNKPYRNIEDEGDQLGLSKGHINCLACEAIL